MSRPSNDWPRLDFCAMFAWSVEAAVTSATSSS
jgi:hypothetical protein